LQAKKNETSPEYYKTGKEGYAKLAQVETTSGLYLGSTQFEC